MSPPVPRASCGHPLDTAMLGVSSIEGGTGLQDVVWGFEDLCRSGIHQSVCIYARSFWFALIPDRSGLYLCQIVLVCIYTRSFWFVFIPDRSGLYLYQIVLVCIHTRSFWFVFIPRRSGLSLY